jgi:error-prone DNA polymerase
MAFPVPHGRGDQVRHGGSGPSPGELPPKGLRTRDIYIPDLNLDTIKVRTKFPLIRSGGAPST